MTRLLRHLSPYAQALTAGILVLAGLIILEVAMLDFNSATATPGSGGNTEEGAMTVASAPAIGVVSIPPLPTYQELRTRPLFMQTRRPVPRQTGGPAAQRVDPGTKWKLTAIIVAGDDSHVFVQGIRDKAMRRLDAGQVLDGWTVSEIAPQYVTFTSGEAESRLELRKEADQE